VQTVVIRDYNVKDFRELLEIDAEVFKSKNPAYDVYVYLTYGSDLLVADIGNRVVGYIVTMDIDRYTGKIISFAVKPEYRRMGIGTMLLRNAIERLKSRGKKRILLEVRVSNVEAQRLYKKFGFKTISTLPRYYSDGEDAYLMELSCENF